MPAESGRWSYRLQGSLRAARRSNRTRSKSSRVPKPPRFAWANGIVEPRYGRAEVAELADASVSKTDVRKDVRVRLPLSAPGLPIAWGGGRWRSHRPEGKATGGRGGATGSRPRSSNSGNSRLV